MVMEETTGAALASRIDELIALCETLVRENRAFQREQAAWRVERAKLIERNELAKNKIDAMIDRLRSLDEPEGGGQTSMSVGDVPAAAAAVAANGPVKAGR